MNDDQDTRHVMPVEPTVVQFHRDPTQATISCSGPIRRGGRLVVEYDPVRLHPVDAPHADGQPIQCHVRFGADAPPQRATMLPPSGGMTPTAAWMPLRAEVLVPPDATQVELWFERVGPTGTTRWDSRYGQNYLLEVDGQDLLVPAQSVAPRPDAVVAPDRIQVVDDTAHKADTPLGGGGNRLHTDLVVRARMAAMPPDATACADIHVFDLMGGLIHTATLVLAPRALAEDGVLVVLAADVYQGSSGGSGMGVSHRPDAHTVQYRVYCQAGGQMFTDGVLHQFAVPSDAAARHRA